MKSPEHPHWLPWAPQIQVHWGPCRNLLSWVTLNREGLASSCKFIFIINTRGEDQWANPQDMLREKKDSEERGRGGGGKVFISTVFWCFTLFLWGMSTTSKPTPHLIYPSCLLHHLMTTLKPQAHHSLHCLVQSSVLWRGEAGFSLAKAGRWHYVSTSVPWEHAVTHAHPRFLRAGEGVSCPAAEGQTPVQNGHYLVSEDWPASLTSVETSGGPAGSDKQTAVTKFALKLKKNPNNLPHRMMHCNHNPDFSQTQHSPESWKNTNTKLCPRLQAFRAG